MNAIKKQNTPGYSPQQRKDNEGKTQRVIGSLNTWRLDKKENKEQYRYRAEGVHCYWTRTTNI